MDGQNVNLQPQPPARQLEASLNVKEIVRPRPGGHVPDSVVAGIVLAASLGCNSDGIGVCSRVAD